MRCANYRAAGISGQVIRPRRTNHPTVARIAIDGSGPTGGIPPAWARGWPLREDCDLISRMARRRVDIKDRDAVARFIETHWKSRTVMSRGRAYQPHEHAGFLETRKGRIVGLLTMVYEDDTLQILTLNSVLEGERIGSSLMLMAIEEARGKGVSRIWLTTTNDNLKAMGFYQRLGFRIVQVNVGAVDEARKTKPQIPETGMHGIPIHDEIVMELRLKAYT